MMERLFNQSAVWDEVIPSATSLTKEGHETHTLDNVRICEVTAGRSADTMGYKASDSSVLYFLNGFSLVDGLDGIFPMIKAGDRIESGARKLTVTSVSVFAGLDGEDHHMEVTLR